MQTSHPLALQALQTAGIAIRDVRSKSWDEFATPGAPTMDLVIPVCAAAAAGEACPTWPGHPATAHRGYADPSAGDAPDEKKREAFRKTLHAIHYRLERLINLPSEKLEPSIIQASARDLAKH